MMYRVSSLRGHPTRVRCKGKKNSMGAVRIVVSFVHQAAFDGPEPVVAQAIHQLRDGLRLVEHCSDRLVAKPAGVDTRSNIVDVVPDEMARIHRTTWKSCWASPCGDPIAVPAIIPYS
jgi:hypothetical protein